jgi:hypothetical protein
MIGLGFQTAQNLDQGNPGRANPLGFGHVDRQAAFSFYRSYYRAYGCGRENTGSRNRAEAVRVAPFCNVADLEFPTLPRIHELFLVRAYVTATRAREWTAHWQLVLCSAVL